MTTASTAPPHARGFQFGLPAGFLELPVDLADLSPESFGALRGELADLFGFDADDQNAEAAAVGLATLGLMIDGVDYAAVGIYRSPDDADRPIMIVLTATGLSSDHDRQETAIAGLLDIHEAEDRGTVGRLTLPAGPAVAVVTEQQSILHIGEGSALLLQRQVAAWLPDPAGSTIAVVSASTNSWRDWEHVCALALDIFESLEWSPPDKVGTR